MRAYKFTPFSLTCLKCLEIEVEFFLNGKCCPVQSRHWPGDSLGACVGSGHGVSVKDFGEQLSYQSPERSVPSWTCLFGWGNY